jgi:hypothetical protein
MPGFHLNTVLQRRTRDGDEAGRGLKHEAFGEVEGDLGGMLIGHVFPRHGDIRRWFGR